MYSGYMSRLPAVSARSTISELPMSLLSRTRKPCASSDRLYSSPSTNCSGKFFVPIVISPPGPVFPVSLPPPFEPPPPQPASSAIRRTATAAVSRPRVISGDGRLVARRLGRGDLRGQGEPERAALAGRALRPDAAAVMLDDPLADREPDAGSGVRALAVQPVEGLEDLLGLARLHADPIVAHGEPPRRVDAVRRDLHARVAVRELHGVRDQVLEHLADVAVVRVNGGHLAHLDRRAGF